MGVNINMNDQVKLKLTKSGLKALSEDVYRSHIEINDGNIIIIHLWECMNIFGAGMFNGCNIPFEKNNIEVMNENE